ncbi:MAG TPA: cytochrome P460 family protein [Candidatus Acidoferrales bacterium]|nr:cytochrome P460 family protein [Candidatus Acidoferrales bacterium]
MRNSWVAIGSFVVLLAALVPLYSHPHFSWVSAAQSSPSADNLPQYDSSGALIRPRNFESWVFVGASTGLSYEPGIGSRGDGEFKNVYITPEAYKSYLATGKFPEKTMLALAVYDPSAKVSPAVGGSFEGEFASLAFAVKDHGHAREGWSYYNFRGDEGHLANSVEAFSKSQCYSCHNQHAADDNVFVQFYPVLRKILNDHKGAAARSR